MVNFCSSRPSLRIRQPASMGRHFLGSHSSISAFRVPIRAFLTRLPRDACFDTDACGRAGMGLRRADGSGPPHPAAGVSRDGAPCNKSSYGLKRMSQILPDQGIFQPTGHSAIIIIGFHFRWRLRCYRGWCCSKLHAHA